MKKISITFLVLFLILTTALIKNSTKRIEDEIFVIEENIRSLKKDLENVKLEHNYLSSAEKLNEFQDLYFDEKLEKKNIYEIKVIYQTQDKIKIEQLKLIKE